MKNPQLSSDRCKWACERSTHVRVETNCSRLSCTIAFNNNNNMIKFYFNFLNLKFVPFKSKRRRLFSQCSCYSTSKRDYLLLNFKTVLFGFVWFFLIFHASCSYDKQKTCKRVDPKFVTLCRHEHV